MTGKEHTKQSGARKVSRAQSRPTPPAARSRAAAAKPSDSKSPAREDVALAAAAPAPERTGPFYVELPFTVEHAIGLDPATLPPHRLRQIAAVRGLAICESLFWVMQQLGHMVSHDGWLYNAGDLGEALDCLGEVGQAVATGASDQAQRLEHIAQRLHEGRE